MSLDFDISKTCKHCGVGSGNSFNITHNCGVMAKEAGIYKCLWHPAEHGFKLASDIISLLEEGISKMKTDPEKYKILEASNGWGTYDQFLPWIEDVLAACKRTPDATIQADI